jgi:hypothetical protein
MNTYQNEIDDLKRQISIYKADLVRLHQKNKDLQKLLPSGWFADDHVDGYWCANLHCSKCYSADTWRKYELEKNAIESAKRLLQVEPILEAAREVTKWDWSDNDDECVEDMHKLRQLLNVFDGLDLEAL